MMVVVSVIWVGALCCHYLIRRVPTVGPAVL